MADNEPHHYMLQDFPHQFLVFVWFVSTLWRLDSRDQARLLSPLVWGGESGDSDKPPNVLSAKKQNISCLNRAFCGEEAWSCFK